MVAWATGGAGMEDNDSDPIGDPFTTWLVDVRDVGETRTAVAQIVRTAIRATPTALCLSTLSRGFSEQHSPVRFGISARAYWPPDACRGDNRQE